MKRKSWKGFSPLQFIEANTEIGRPPDINPSLGPCWLWIGSKWPTGYGGYWLNGESVGAHRKSYEVHKGKKIPKGKQLDHLCKVRACVNPDHLEPVTQKENLLRGAGLAAQNARKIVCGRCGSAFRQLRNGQRRCVSCAAERSRVKAQRRKQQQNWSHK